PCARPKMHRYRALALVSLAELLAMGLWLGMSAVAPQIAKEWQHDAATTAWLTLGVQLGFVAGTLLSATLNLPDVLNVRRLFALCAFLGAVANALLAWLATGVAVAIALRFLTGMFLAGVYPPGMKIIATWFKTGRGFALGVLIGALTLGKASPYLVNVIGSGNWRVNAGILSLLAVLSPLIVLRFVGEGPYALPNQPFDAKQITRVFANRGVRLANFGYFGHMWELYAMWTWTPVMIRASLAGRGSNPQFAEVASFLVIGCGALGSVIAGLVADRVGRTAVTSWAMAISGSCCLLIGFFFGAHPAYLLAIAAV